MEGGSLMTLSDRICQGLASYLESEDDAGLTTFQAGIEGAATEAYTSRVICRATGCAEYSAALKGLFRPTGEIVVRQSIDEDDAVAKFSALCDFVRGTAGNETSTPAGIEAEDDDLTIYPRSWFLDSQAETAGERGFQAIFTWRAVARDTSNTN